ncbi:MAG: inorganic diphosphatase [Acidimicrobiaceae bacterium]|nr:inorganic diphosphatase [Acidimicrobiaceae bacterium]
MPDLLAVIEIPRGSRNKYEVDHDTGAVSLDRTLFTSMVYPTEYGFIPETLGEDGDPLDAMVLLEFPTFPGCNIKVRPVAVFHMSDEAGRDTKILCVPKKDPRWAHIQNVDDVPKQIRSEIEHFFAHYKDLEPNKSVTIEGWGNVTSAEAEIEKARNSYAANSHK